MNEDPKWDRIPEDLTGAVLVVSPFSDPASGSVYFVLGQYSEGWSRDLRARPDPRDESYWNVLKIENSHPLVEVVGSEWLSWNLVDIVVRPVHERTAHTPPESK